MKRIVCLIVLLVMLAASAHAEYSYTQEYKAGSFVVYLPLSFEQTSIAEGLFDMLGHPLLTARFLVETDSPDFSIGDQITVEVGIDAPFASYSTSGESVGFWNELMSGSEGDFSFRRADECVAFVCTENQAYNTTIMIGIINGKDYLQISILSKSHDRAEELLDGIIGGIVAKEFRQP